MGISLARLACRVGLGLAPLAQVLHSRVRRRKHRLPKPRSRRHHRHPRPLPLSPRTSRFCCSPLAPPPGMNLRGASASARKVPSASTVPATHRRCSIPLTSPATAPMTHGSIARKTPRPAPMSRFISPASLVRRMQPARSTPSAPSLQHYANRYAERLCAYRRRAVSQDQQSARRRGRRRQETRSVACRHHQISITDGGRLHHPGWQGRRRSRQDQKDRGPGRDGVGALPRRQASSVHAVGFQELGPTAPSFSTISRPGVRKSWYMAACARRSGLPTTRVWPT